MTDDLVKHLRDAGRAFIDNQYNFQNRAADRIEQLEAELRICKQQLMLARRLAYRPQPEYQPEIGIPHLKED